ncbi:MAG: hypothetical protein ABL311_11075 [Nitratireductor rhodophyticola]|uniref:hypothetical protein n=1 Tax=Nitratireductor rhodophyticola TaxID=2854036 RepID=UPI0032D90674
MKTPFRRFARSIPVSSQAGLRLTAIRAGRAERAKKAEGKIKEHGTTLQLFWKLLLSAHRLGPLIAAPCFWTPRAAVWRKTLVFLDFDRHHGRKSPCFWDFRSVTQP